ncbi:hypothetical protein NX059_005005 [Plenodomus lindquistii]|nr:hypothetical protein NX059_005005 [Plenodomus lindquistii]
MTSSVGRTSNELCGVCATIMDTIRMEGNYRNLTHHQSFSSLSRSANTACGICTALLEHVELQYLQGISQGEEADIHRRMFPILCSSDTSCVAWQSSFEVALTSGGLDDLKLVFTLEAAQENRNDEDQYLPASTTDSESAQQLVISWMKHCVKEHGRCNAQRSEKWCPRRLLDIGCSENAGMRLIMGDDALPNHPYATLSHCWGHTPVPRTFQRNFSERCEQIHSDELSNTFNHAIRIARSLGLRYLWIDSLCIVQDDLDDWEREAALMSNVYRNSYINIAATGARGGTEGCHWEREPWKILRTTLAMDWTNSEGVRRQHYHVVPDPEYWARKLMNEPLNNRAWIFQERILSPRVIHFAKSQLFWECRETIACETYCKGLPSSLRQNTFVDIKTLDLGDEPQDKRWPAKYISSTEEPPKTSLQRIWRIISGNFRPVMLQEATLHAAMKDASVYQDWDTMVELYSLGTLTYSTDKLAALAGIASVIQFEKRANSQDGYLAGLWQSSLPLHLLWISEVHTNAHHQAVQARTPTTYGQYIAPSWSWASINGRISFEWCRNNYSTKDYFATIEDAKVTWAHGNFRFGPLEAAEMSVTAPMATVLWNPVSSPPGTAPMSGTITHICPIGYDQQTAVSVPPDIETASEIRFDTVLDEPPQLLILLPIISTTKKLAHESDLALGLVLCGSEVSTMFRRIGVFHTTRPRINGILRKLPRRTVTIV